MKKHWLFKIGVVVFLLVQFSCVNEEKKKLPFENKKEYESLMIRSHKAFLEKEKQKIDEYIEHSDLKFTKTGTGLRYCIYQKRNGDSLNTGDIAVIKYTLRLLDGDTLYETNASEVQEFAVDFDEVERGVHEGIKLMKVGESAQFILPAHLAHGVTGDQHAIPTQSTIVYDLTLVAKR